MKKVKDFFFGFLLINLLWLVLSYALQLKVLPDPITVWRTGTQGNWIFHIAASLGRMGVGLLLAFGAGIPMGIGMASSPYVDKVLRPLSYFAYPVPKTALLPVAMLLFGLGDLSKVFILALTVLFQVVFAVRDGILATDPNYYNVAICAGLSKSRCFFHITLPSIVPGLFTCLRTGLGTGLALLFFVEAYGTYYGIGYSILDAWAKIDYIKLYKGISVISLVGASLFLITDLLETWICRYRTGSYSGKQDG